MRCWQAVSRQVTRWEIYRGLVVKLSHQATDSCARKSFAPGRSYWHDGFFILLHIDNAVVWGETPLQTLILNLKG
jgi:hypothetical protein